MGIMGAFVGNNWVVLRALQNRMMERFGSTFASALMLFRL